MKVGDVFVVNLWMCHREGDTFFREMEMVKEIDPNTGAVMLINHGRKTYITNAHTLGLWSEKDRADAAEQHWEIQKNDGWWCVLPTSVFSEYYYRRGQQENLDDCDLESVHAERFACRLMFQKAREGSLLHLKAIIHIREQSPEQYARLVNLCE